MKTWGILGLGWLGSTLQQTLEAQGQPTWGTHRAECDLLTGPLPTKSCDVLFLNTPPLKALAPSAFADKIATTSAARIIFISSTSVFGEGQLHVTEADTPRPDSPNGQWLLATEEALRARLTERLSIIRPGGLIGGERHPIRSLAGKTGIPDGVVNLIHRTDLVGLILEAPRAPVINAVAPFHPLKSAYYGAWAQKLNLPAPQFLSPPAQRIVSSRHLDGFAWRCANLDWI